MSAHLEELVARRQAALTALVAADGRQLAACCHAVARAFARGGTLVAYGCGAAATDAAHVAVEFMHPVIVGKRALPAVAAASDPTGRLTLERIARAGDVAVSIAHGPEQEPVRRFREDARRAGLLTVAFTGGERVGADFSFAVADEDAQVVQEVQETVYHVLWELVHVFFEHPGLLDDACITCGDVAVEARVVAVHRGGAVIERDGLREQVAVELVSPVSVGDTLLCHAGVALEKVS